MKTCRGSAYRLQLLQFHLSYSLRTVIATSKVQERFPEAAVWCPHVSLRNGPKDLQKWREFHPFPGAKSDPASSALYV